MQCYFQREGRLAGVEMLPVGLSDEDAIARALIRPEVRTADIGGNARTKDMSDAIVSAIAGNT